MSSKEKSIGKIPNLRFQGFKQEWKPHKMSDLGDFHGGGTPSSSVERYWQGNIPWISSSDLKEGNINLINPSRFITEEAIINSATKLLNAPALLIVSRVGVGKVALSSNDVCTSQDFTNICSIKCIPKFLAYSTLILMKRAANQVQGTSIKGISSSEIKSKIIFLPNEEEQIKISDFISVIDSKIETQKKTIQVLEKLVQKFGDDILSQKIRFKSDSEEDFPNWQKMKLEDVCLKQSSNISANKIEDNFGQYPIYGATGLLKNVDFYNVDTQYIAIIKDGAGVGRLFICEEKSSVLGTLDIILPKDINLHFLYLLLSKIDFNKYTTGSTIPHIYFKDYKNENCLIPSLEEQTKIANFLNAFDKKIELETEILNKLEEQKRYFLQNLFV
ncbi:MAG: restriction endonuclease subunit S [Cloacibacterium sp.]|nr:restriction endonuclease subunit S [Cloacibacterium sp.]